MLLVPPLVVLVAVGDRAASYVAAGIFVIGAATDGLDGYLARRHAATTRTGQWLDPLADKVFVAAPVITLAVLDEFPVWAAVIIVAREVGVVALRAFAGVRGRSMPASGLAKVKTTMQLAAITLYILPLGRDANALRLTVLVVAVVLTVVTGLQYAAREGPWARPSPAGRGSLP